jgi:hypothetical protein
MTRTWRRAGLALVLLLLLALAYNFVFPFGLVPRFGGRNCGPEHRRWLRRSFEGTPAVVAYLQAHELELLSGTGLPRLDAFPAGSIVSRYDGAVDWPSIAQAIQVQHRPGYVVYTLTYHHPACWGNQSYTFKVTSYGLASLYGCCGI